MSKRSNITLARAASMLLGVSAAGLGCYGAFTYAMKVEGEVSYLAIAAPLVAAAAALIPPLAESEWRRRQRLKAVLWWLLLAPTAATVFYASAERVHMAKSGVAAEHVAAREAVGRAQSERDDAKARLEKAIAKASRSKNEAVIEASARAQAAFDKADSKLTQVQGKAVRESDLTAPSWLLPLSLDLVAFMAIWSALTGPRPKPKAPSKKKTKAKRRSPAPRPPKAPVVLLREQLQKRVGGK